MYEVYANQQITVQVRVPLQTITETSVRIQVCVICVHLAVLL